MLTLDELSAAVARGEIDTVLTVFPDIYGRLLGKRLTGRFFVEHGADGTHVCDYLLTCDMEMDPVQGYQFASWTEGYGDMRAVPDLSTLRRIAWLPGTALVLCDLISDADGTPIDLAPRQMLQKQLAAASELGYGVAGGTELEFYMFDESYASARQKQFHGLTTAGSYVEDYHILQTTREEPLLRAVRIGMEASGVPVEGTKGEWGPGQQELNLNWCDALTQADRAALCKHGLREIADAQGKAVTFMAKWDAQLAGSGLHVHLSLWDKDNVRNVFAGDQSVGTVKCSDEFRWFLGGLLAYARELTPWFAPNVNSYKRFQSGSFAPTGIAWSADNRTAGFRVVGQGPSLRIECRIPGADANVYLVYATLIAAGLEGIRARIEPPPPFSGDIYQAEELPQLPRDLRDAIEAAAHGELAQNAFGLETIQHYLHFWRTEQRKYDEVVTDWEKARFFERG
jgi:glutamine synthetase